MNNKFQAALDEIEGKTGKRAVDDRRLLNGFLAMAPGSGDLMAARDSVSAGGRMVNSFKEGRYRQAGKELLSSLLAGAGALPAVPAISMAFPKNIKRLSEIKKRFPNTYKLTGFDYLLPDGTFLNVPGHGAVGNIPKFLDETGSIRINKNKRGDLAIEIIGKPTMEQIETLRSLDKSVESGKLVSVEGFSNGKKVVDEDFSTQFLQKKIGEIVNKF